MPQGKIGRFLFLLICIVGGLAAAGLQGWIVFLWQELPGPFLSATGFKCTIIPLGIEAVIAIVAIKTLHEMHLRNPHVHGAGRPATEQEARSAASGRPHDARLDDRQF